MNANECRGKQSFLSKKEAKAWSRIVTEKNMHFGGTPTHVYRCSACRAFHFGHPIGTRSNAA